MKIKEKDMRIAIASYLFITLLLTMFILEFTGRHTWAVSVLVVVLLSAYIVQGLYSVSLKKKIKRMDQQLNLLKQEKEQIGKQYFYENLQINMEYSALQNQINPHFLYNTLDAIRSQAILIQAMEIADMTEKLSRFFRYSIRNQDDLVIIAEEVKNTKDYFSIQHYRFEDRFSLKILLEDEKVQNYYIPKLTFQPLVENALYHGLEPKKGTGEVTIRIERSSHNLHIVIADNGVGMKPEQVMELNQIFLDFGQDVSIRTQNDPKNKRTGIALLNVHKRLYLLFRENYSMSINSTLDMGTDIEISIPCVDEEARSNLLRLIKGESIAKKASGEAT